MCRRPMAGLLSVVRIAGDPWPSGAAGRKAGVGTTPAHSRRPVDGAPFSPRGGELPRAALSRGRRPVARIAPGASRTLRGLEAASRAGTAGPGGGPIDHPCAGGWDGTLFSSQGTTASFGPVSPGPPGGAGHAFVQVKTASCRSLSPLCGVIGSETVLARLAQAAQCSVSGVLVRLVKRAASIAV